MAGAINRKLTREGTILFDLNVVARYFPFLIRGVGITIQFTFISFLIAIVLGLLIALGRVSNNKIIRVPCQIYIDFIRGTPLLAQIYLVHFGLQMCIRDRHARLSTTLQRCTLSGNL